jgi:hypothetical protein
VNSNDEIGIPLATRNLFLIVHIQSSSFGGLINHAVTRTEVRRILEHVLGMVSQAMNVLETIDQASQQLRGASPSQATDILRQLTSEFSNGSYFTSHANIFDETEATTGDFEAVIHAKFIVNLKHPAS